MAYVPHNEADRREMLDALGLESMDDLFRALPESIRLHRDLDLPAMATEVEILRDLGSLATRNRRMDDRPSFLGAGVYHRFIPAAIDALASRGELMTAYTPYQAEVSQGTLQAIIEYQTLICQLTGMEISNASMYDAATGLAESVLMAWAIRGKGRLVYISAGVHPEYRRVLETYVRHHPIELATLPLVDDRTDLEALRRAAEAGEETLAVVLQNPNFLGSIEETEAVRASLESVPEAARPILIGVVDPISLGVLETPGAWGADIAIGDGQQLGNPPNLGGPTFGFFATRHKHVRKVPGRIVGETTDREGRRGYVLTFQTREQHIRRERATSNICTNQGLCSLRGAMYLAFLGKEGLREVAETTLRKAHHAAARLTAIDGIERPSNAPFFQEFPIRLPLPADEVYAALDRRGIGGGLALGRFDPSRDQDMLIACTEMTTAADIDALCAALEEILRGDADISADGKRQNRRVVAP